MNQFPLISIVVPIYNCQKYLSRCIGCVLNQTYTNFELILIDDGSTDNSLALCNKWSSVDCRIKVIHQSNAGVSRARNKGIEAASGKYITFIDSDDWISYDYIESMLHVMNDDIQLVVGSLAIVYRRLCINPLASQRYDASNVDLAVDLLVKLEFQAPWAKLFSLDIIKNNSITFPEDIKNGEDQIFVRNYLMKCTAFRTISNTIYYYNKINPSSATKRAYDKAFDWCKTIALNMQELLLKWQIPPAKRVELLSQYSTNMILEHINICVLCNEKNKAISQIEYCLSTLNDLIFDQYINNASLKEGFCLNNAQQIYNVVSSANNRFNPRNLIRNIINRIINPLLEVFRYGLHKYDNITTS